MTILGDAFPTLSLDDINGGSCEYEDRGVTVDGLMVDIDDFRVDFILVAMLFGIGAIGILGDGTMCTGSMFTVGQGHESHSHDILATLA